MQVNELIVVLAVSSTGTVVVLSIVVLSAVIVVPAVIVVFMGTIEVVVSFAICIGSVAKTANQIRVPIRTPKPLAVNPTVDAVVLCVFLCLWLK